MPEVMRRLTASGWQSDEVQAHLMMCADDPGRYRIIPVRDVSQRISDREQPCSARQSLLPHIAEARQEPCSTADLAARLRTTIQGFSQGPSSKKLRSVKAADGCVVVSGRGVVRMSSTGFGISRLRSR